MRLLIYAINGKGMGHLNRTSIIAKSLREVDPSIEVAFLAGSPLYGILADLRFEVVKVPDRHHTLGFLAGMNQRPVHMASLFRQLMEHYAPDVFLTDFALNEVMFKDANRVGAKVAVVLRKQRALDLMKTTLSPALRRVDRILLPHDEHEWPRTSLPRPLRSRAVHMGDVVRGLDVNLVPSVRAQYAEPNERLVVVTIGGGGYTEAHPLLEVAERAAHLAQEGTSALQGTRWVAVYGPYYPFDVPTSAHPWLTRVRYAANMPELLAAADVVVSNAGYNTINELQTCGTPAVVVPRTTRGRDDQVARAEAFAKTGRGVTCAEDPRTIANKVEDILLRQALTRNTSSNDVGGLAYRRTLGTTVLAALQSS